MKFVTNYKELDGEDEGISIFDNISDLSIDNKDMVLKYLRNIKKLGNC